MKTSDIKIGKIYKAKEPICVLSLNNIPFQTVKVTSIENDIVTFETEYPVRQVECSVMDFIEYF